MTQLEDIIPIGSFTFKNIKPGMIIEIRNGAKCISLNSRFYPITDDDREKCEFAYLSPRWYTMNFSNEEPDYDIMKVYSSDCLEEVLKYNDFTHTSLYLEWERKEYNSMSTEDVKEVEEDHDEILHRFDRLEMKLNELIKSVDYILNELD